MLARSAACFRCLVVVSLLTGTSLLGGMQRSASAADAPNKKAAQKATGSASKPKLDTTRGDDMLAAYMRTETHAVADHCLADIHTLADWTSHREESHRQLREMLGLDPWPERSDLRPMVLGKVEHEEFTVENITFQSLPGLYVTGNLYLPKNLDKPAPCILYVCGHGRVKKNGISYGNKTHYQHHGAWYARNGYVCFTIDTIQLGELEGLHHGTHNLNMWWWNSRGYTPAGVEAWNGIRALDYLETRPEVDKQKFGVTGRSGGGAYSWWIAALDERIKAAVPTAGITDLENHVIDGKISGHCDCMFMVNTYRWDYAQVAAMVAPRPLLLSNTDKDPIFPLEGVFRVHNKVREIYRLYGADKNFGLQITEGGHADTQELHIHAFRWFNRFLKDDTTSQVDIPAVKLFQPEQLKVFKDLPQDEITTKIHESFVAAAKAPEVPESQTDWNQRRRVVMDGLRDKVFRGWPIEREALPLQLQPAFSAERDGVHLSAYDFTSQHDTRLRLYVTHRAGLNPADLDLVVLNVLDPETWNEWLAAMRPAFGEELREETLPEAAPAEFEELKKLFTSFKWGMAFIAPRGVGPTAWDQTPKQQIHIRRRFLLLGQTLAGMQVWDTRRAVQALREVDGWADVPLWLQGERDMSVVALYASLFEPDIDRLDLWSLPDSHMDAGPDFLNVLRIVDLPEVVALAAERAKVRIYQTGSDIAGEGNWKYPQSVASQLKWDEKQLQLRTMPAAKNNPEKAAGK